MSEKNDAQEPKTPEIQPISDEALEEIAGGFCSVAGCSNGTSASREV